MDNVSPLTNRQSGNMVGGEDKLDSKRQIKVLMVDDEPLVLHATSRLLMNSDFLVYTTELWAKVPALVRRVEPDIIMLDYNMPSLKGDDICAILRQNKPKTDTKIVYYSSEEEAFLKDVVKKSGADGYIRKGTSPVELIRRLQDMVKFDTALAKTAAPSVRAEAKSAASALRNVLLVDDSPLPRKMWKQIIGKKYTCDVVEAENGYEALQQLGKFDNIDLILLDINMPVMNGLQFLETVRSGGKFKHIPVIIVSTEDKDSDVLRGLSLGARGYIIKPFTSNSLYSVVDNVLKKDPTVKSNSNS